MYSLQVFFTIHDFHDSLKSVVRSGKQNDFEVARSNKKKAQITYQVQVILRNRS